MVERDNLVVGKSMESMDPVEWELVNGGSREGTAAAVSDVLVLECIRSHIHIASSRVFDELTARYPTKKESGLAVNPFAVLEQIGSHLGVDLSDDMAEMLPLTDRRENFPILHYKMRCLLTSLNRIYVLTTQLMKDDMFARLEHEMRCLLTYMSQILDMELIKDSGQMIAPPRTLEERKQQMLKKLKKCEELKVLYRAFKSNLSNK